MRTYLFTFFIFQLSLNWAQKINSFDTLNFFHHKSKYVFERVNHKKNKKINAGSDVELYFKSKDTIHILRGILIDVSDSNITIQPTKESFLFDTLDISFSKITEVKHANIQTIPLTNLSLIDYHRTLENVPIIVGAFTLFYAIFVAPIASIDPNEPHYFNTKKYKILVFGALMGTGLGVAFTAAMVNGGKIFHLKPKLIKKII